MLVANVRGARRRASLLGVADHPLVGLHTDDLAGRPDQLGEQEQDVAEAGTQIEDAHPLPMPAARSSATVGCAIVRAWSSSRATSAASLPST